MARKRAKSRGKKIRPHFWVFCEGKTEESYVCFLRSNYRIQIELVPKVVGSNIDDRYIKNYKKGKPTHEKDIDFLMYDADIPEVLDRLLKIDSAIPLISNPSIEVWFLLHYKNQISSITGDSCEKELNNRNKIQYKKGVIDKKLAIKLSEKQVDAYKRAKKLKPYGNPSSGLWKLIEILEGVKKNDNETQQTPK